MDEWTASWDTGECTPGTCGDLAVVTCNNGLAGFRAAFDGPGEMVGMRVSSDSEEFCDESATEILYGGPLACIR